MANYAEHFVETVFDWCAEALDTVPTTEQMQTLYDRLDLTDYAERLYIITRDDVMSVFEDRDIQIRKESFKDAFWEAVRNRIEAGLGGCWFDIVSQALDDVLAVK